MGRAHRYSLRPPLPAPTGGDGSGSKARIPADPVRFHHGVVVAGVSACATVRSTESRRRDGRVSQRPPLWDAPASLLGQRSHSQVSAGRGSGARLTPEVPPAREVHAARAKRCESTEKSTSSRIPKRPPPGAARRTTAPTSPILWPPKRAYGHDRGDLAEFPAPPIEPHQSHRGGSLGHRFEPSQQARRLLRAGQLRDYAAVAVIYQYILGHPQKSLPATGLD
jgi:hypothetical protein